MKAIYLNAFHHLADLDWDALSLSEERVGAPRVLLGSLPWPHLRIAAVSADGY